jgi:hypothetical protein
MQHAYIEEPTTNNTHRYRRAHIEALTAHISHTEELYLVGPSTHTYTSGRAQYRGQKNIFSFGRTGDIYFSE